MTSEILKSTHDSTTYSNAKNRSCLAEFLTMIYTYGSEEHYKITIEATSTGNLIACYYQENDENYPVEYFPTKISEIRILSGASSGIAQFLSHLDETILSSLNDLGIDDFSCYALLHNHPELNYLISKPLLLRLAGARLQTFKEVYYPQKPYYTHWLPDLMEIATVTRGMLRALSRIKLTGNSLLAADFIACNFKDLHTIFPNGSEIDPDLILDIRNLLSAEPVLRGARWLKQRFVWEGYDTKDILMYYRDTKTLLENLPDQKHKAHLLLEYRSFDSLVALHNKLASIHRTRTMTENSDLVIFDTRTTREFGDFHIVRSKGQLLRIAESYRNCVSNYIDECLEGSLIFVEYRPDRRNRALLSIKWNDGRLEYDDYLGPNNVEPTLKAANALPHFLKHNKISNIDC